MPTSTRRWQKTVVRNPRHGKFSDWVCAIRRAKLPDPAVIGNAGSFFKNPTVSPEQCADIIARDPKVVHYHLADGAIKLAAGWLIDSCGWKGKSVGQAGVYEKQALVLVNRGAGSRHWRHRWRGDDTGKGHPDQCVRTLWHFAGARTCGAMTVPCGFLGHVALLLVRLTVGLVLVGVANTAAWAQAPDVAAQVRARKAELESLCPSLLARAPLSPQQACQKTLCLLYGIKSPKRRSKPSRVLKCRFQSTMPTRFQTRWPTAIHYRLATTATFMGLERRSVTEVAWTNPCAEGAWPLRVQCGHEQYSGFGWCGLRGCNGLRKTGAPGLQSDGTNPTIGECPAPAALPTVTLVELDVHDAGALERIVAGHDAVINLIAILHGSPEAFDKVHVDLPKKLVKACLAQGVRKLVHISALGVSSANPGSRPSGYLRSKERGEAVLLQAVAGSDLELTLLRPSIIFGAKDKFLNLFAKLQSVFPVMPLAGAGARFQPVWVDDVATAMVRSLEQTVPGRREVTPYVFWRPVAPKSLP